MKERQILLKDENEEIGLLFECMCLCLCVRERDGRNVNC